MPRPRLRAPRPPDTPRAGRGLRVRRPAPLSVPRPRPNARRLPQGAPPRRRPRTASPPKSPARPKRPRAMATGARTDRGFLPPCGRIRGTLPRIFFARAPARFPGRLRKGLWLTFSAIHEKIREYEKANFCGRGRDICGGGVCLGRGRGIQTAEIDRRGVF